MNDVDVIPRLKLLRDLRVRLLVGRAQVRQRLAGKHHAPTEGVVWPIALVNLNAVRRVGLLHQDRKIQPRRPPTDDVDVHSVWKSSPQITPIGSSLSVKSV